MREVVLAKFPILLMLQEQCEILNVVSSGMFYACNTIMSVALISLTFKRSARRAETRDPWIREIHAIA